MHDYLVETLGGFRANWFRVPAGRLTPAIQRHSFSPEIFEGSGIMSFTSDSGEIGSKLPSILRIGNVRVVTMETIDDVRLA